MTAIVQSTSADLALRWSGGVFGSRALQLAPSTLDASLQSFPAVFTRSLQLLELSQRHLLFRLRRFHPLLVLDLALGSCLLCFCLQLAQLRLPFLQLGLHLRHVSVFE